LKKLGAVLVCVGSCVGLQAQQAPVNLNSLVTFGVLGGSTVTSTGFTVVNGNLGLSPGSAVTGFPPGIVSPPYTININNTAAVNAQADLTTAYNDAATPSRPGSAPITRVGDLGGLVLPPGLYVAPSTTMSVGVGETLTLNGAANSVWVFQVGSSLNVLGSVVLTGGAQASNVFWAVNQSASLGVGSVMVGTIMAGASVTLATGASLSGRALAKAAVTMQSNAIAQPGAANINPAPPAPAVFCPVSTANVGTPYSSSLLATGGTTPYTFSTTGVLPAGLTLNTATGAITGTPTTAGPDAFTARVVDALLVPASVGCTITVAAAFTLVCPTSSATAGTPYNSSLTVAGGTAPYTFSITAGALPAGLALTAASGAITGTPTTAGPDIFTAQAADSSGGLASQSCSLTTAALPPATPAPTSLSLVLIGLACAVLYRSRERIMRLIGRS
jgi:hypothetical protein